MAQTRGPHPNPAREGSFGERLARLRKQAGYSQRSFAKEIGISNRMVAYYEKQTNRPPASLLPVLARALGITTDELLGVRPLSERKRPKDGRLWRRFAKLERLPERERRKVVEVIDAFLEREELKRDSREDVDARLAARAG